MRKHSAWLTQADERILEFLSEYGNHQPKSIRDQLEEIGSGMDYSHNHIGERCRELADYGLLINVGGGVYSITGDGEQFLSGDLDAAGLSRDG